MQKTRRSFTADFKFKVVLEALKERVTLSELAKKFSLHPQQITDWKAQFLKMGSSVFDGGKGDGAAELQKQTDALYRKIGELEMEKEYLKKRLV
jgi:transposase